MKINKKTLFPPQPEQPLLKKQYQCKEHKKLPEKYLLQCKDINKRCAYVCSTDLTNLFKNQPKYVSDVKSLLL
jgi:hypothetical protein